MDNNLPAVVGAIMLVMGALILFVIGGVVAPSLIVVSEDFVETPTSIEEAFDSGTYSSWVQLNNTDIRINTETVSNSTTTFTSSNATISITDEMFNSSTYDTWIQLNHTLIVEGSDIVTNQTWVS